MEIAEDQWTFLELMTIAFKWRQKENTGKIKGISKILWPIALPKEKITENEKLPMQVINSSRKDFVA